MNSVSQTVTPAEASQPATTAANALSDVNAEDLLTGDLFPKEVEMKDAPTVAAADEAEKANSDTVDDDPKGSEIAPGTDTAKGSSESDKKADTVKKSEAEKPSRSKGDPRRKKDAKLGNMEIHSEATAESDALAVPTHPDYDPKDKYWGDVFKLSELETVILRHERTKTGVKLFLNSETAGRKNVIIVDFAKQPGRYAKLQKTLAVQNYLANKKVPTLKELKGGYGDRQVVKLQEQVGDLENLARNQERELKKLELQVTELRTALTGAYKRLRDCPSPELLVLYRRLANRELGAEGMSQAHEINRAHTAAIDRVQRALGGIECS